MLRALLVPLFAGLFLPAMAQEAAVPGTRVSLVPPADFVASARFPGFENAAAGSSIVISEFNAPVAETSAAFTPINLRLQGMALLARREVLLGGREAELFEVTQIAGGVEFAKWMVLAGDDSNTVLIVATFPQQLADRLREPMHRAVLSARLEPPGARDLLAGLPFRIDEGAELKIQNRMQHMLTLARPDAGARPAVEEPVLIVSPSLNPADTSDIAAFSKRRLAQLARIAHVANVRGREVTIAGRLSYELVADAKDSESGASLAVYQATVPDGDHYYLIVGLVGREGAARYLAQFRSIADSLRIAGRR